MGQKIKDINKVYKRKFFLACFLLFLVLLIFVFSSFRALENKIYFLDSELGNSFLLETKSGENFLFGSGSDSRAINFLFSKISFFNRAIDAFVIISNDKRSIGAGIDIVNRFCIKRIVSNFQRKENLLLNKFWKKVYEEKVPIILAESENDLVFSDLAVDIIYPYQAQEESQEIVFKLILKNGKNVLFLNASKNTQNKILSSAASLKSDVIIYLGQIDEEVIKFAGAKKVINLRNNSLEEILL